MTDGLVIELGRDFVAATLYKMLYNAALRSVNALTKLDNKFLTLKDLALICSIKWGQQLFLEYSRLFLFTYRPLRFEITWLKQTCHKLRIQSFWN